MISQVEPGRFESPSGLSVQVNANGSIRLSLMKSRFSVSSSVQGHQFRRSARPRKVAAQR